jgi:hypothetical protein
VGFSRCGRRRPQCVWRGRGHLCEARRLMVRRRSASARTDGMRIRHAHSDAPPARSGARCPEWGRTDPCCEPNTGSPVTRQCPKTGRSFVDTAISRDTRNVADLDTLDTVEHAFTRSCPFTHERSAVRYRPRPLVFMQPRCVLTHTGGAVAAESSDSPSAGCVVTGRGCRSHARAARAASWRCGPRARRRHC